MSTSLEASVLVVGGGMSPGPARLRQLAEAYELIIAADAGVRSVREAELTPSFLTGDFDSVAREDLASVAADRQRHKPDQSETDLEKAILLAIELGAKRIGLAGATGDRIDHSINAVSLMLRHRARAEFALHDAHGDATLVFAPGATISGKPGEKISLIPAPGAMGIRSTGLKYALEGIDLVLGARDGISNELLAAEATLTFTSGSLLVYRILSREPAPR